MCLAADHAVWPQHKNHRTFMPQLDAIRAVDLLPGADALWVQTSYLAKVVSVEVLKAAETPTSFVNLELARTAGSEELVRQLMVAYPESAAAPECFVAVGDSAVL